MSGGRWWRRGRWQTWSATVAPHAGARRTTVIETWSGELDGDRLCIFQYQDYGVPFTPNLRKWKEFACSGETRLMLKRLMECLSYYGMKNLSGLLLVTTWWKIAIVCATRVPRFRPRPIYTSYTGWRGGDATDYPRLWKSEFEDYNNLVFGAKPTQTKKYIWIKNNN